MQKPLFETVFDTLHDQFVGKTSGKHLSEAEEADQAAIEAGRAELLSYFNGTSAKILNAKRLIEKVKAKVPAAASVLMEQEKGLDKAAINIGKLIVEIKAAPANAQMAKTLEIVKTNFIPHIDAVIKSLTDEITQYTSSTVSEGVADKIGIWGKEVFSKMMNAVFGDLDAIDVAIKELRT